MSYNILITGGAGFIGSHLLHHFIKKYPEYKIINVDLLTYASELKNINFHNNKNYNFIKGDICDFSLINNIFKKYKINRVIHLAAESHVDRSIEDPFIFAKTNILGTLNLLNAANSFWKKRSNSNLFHHISTDEIYGSIEKPNSFSENNSIKPNSPYSASKASSNHFVRAFSKTYNLPVIISNSSNNYGPNQNREKLIPSMIEKLINEQELTIYGDGENIRDWIHVYDHIEAIDKIFHEGRVSEVYNIGANNELSNNKLIHRLIEIFDRIKGNPAGFSVKLIRYVKDRKGHDFRYSICTDKINRDLGWYPKINFSDGLEKTVKWYIKK